MRRRSLGLGSLTLALHLHLPAHHHPTSHAERLQHARHRLAQLRARDADELRARTSGIEERAEEVENCPLPAFRTELARRADVLEGWMICLREEKGEALLAQSTRRLVGRQVDADAERFQHVRAAGLRRDCAVSVLGHGDARRRANDGDGGRDVERVQPVAPGAADIEDLALACRGVERGLHGQLAKLSGEGSDLFGRLAFLRQCRQEPSLGFGGNGFADQMADGRLDLLVRQVFPAAKLFGQRFQHGRESKVQSSKSKVQSACLALFGIFVCPAARV